MKETSPAPEAAAPAPSSDACERLNAARRFATEQYDKTLRYAGEQYDKLRRAAGEQMEHVREYTDQARVQINEGWDKTCDKAKELHHAGEEYVKTNPTGSMLGALGVGVLLGLLLGGRR